MVPLVGNDDRTSAESTMEIETAAGEEVFVEGEQDFIKEMIPAPLMVAPIAGLVGGVALGQVVPGSIAADFPEDAIQDGARLEGRATANLLGVGSLLMIVSGEEGLEEAPLLIGKVHG
jgi:hypothetical protein